MKLEWSWPAAVVFVSVFLALAALVFVGKLAPETLGVLLAWLIPSPVQPRPPLPPPSQGVH